LTGKYFVVTQPERTKITVSAEIVRKKMNIFISHPLYSQKMKITEL
jgi:hypothetical protein